MDTLKIADFVLSHRGNSADDIYSMYVQLHGPEKNSEEQLLVYRTVRKLSKMNDDTVNELKSILTCSRN